VRFLAHQLKTETQKYFAVKSKKNAKRLMNNDFQEKDAIRYFFGELSEPELAAVEERFFTDEEFSEWLDEVETDLIDSYVRDELDASQRQKFEAKFLVSERRRSRVKAAAALLENERQIFAPVTRAETVKPSFWESLRGFFSVQGLAYASLGVLLLAALGGLFLFLRRPPEIVRIGNENIQIEPPKLPSPTVSPVSTPDGNQSSNDNSPPSEPDKTPLPEKPKTEPKTETAPTPKQVSPVLAQVSLFSSNSRSSSGGGSQTNKIRLKPETGSVYMRLRFKSEEEFEKYRIELRDAGGNLISSQNVRRQKALGLTVAAKNLNRGDYKITLKGAKTGEDFELLDVFDLAVEKK